jgi:hypothetical protein
MGSFSRQEQTQVTVFVRIELDTGRVMLGVPQSKGKLARELWLSGKTTIWRATKKPFQI